GKTSPTNFSGEIGSVRGGLLFLVTFDGQYPIVKNDVDILAFQARQCYLHPVALFIFIGVACRIPDGGLVGMKRITQKLIDIKWRIAKVKCHGTPFLSLPAHRFGYHTDKAEMQPVKGPR